MEPEDLFKLLPTDYEGKEDFEKAVNNLYEGFGAAQMGLEQTIEEQKAEITRLKVEAFDSMMKNRRNEEVPEEQPQILGVEDLFNFE